MYWKPIEAGWFSKSVWYLPWRLLLSTNAAGALEETRDEDAICRFVADDGGATTPRNSDQLEGIKRRLAPSSTSVGKVCICSCPKYHGCVRTSMFYNSRGTTGPSLLTQLILFCVFLARCEMVERKANGDPFFWLMWRGHSQKPFRLRRSLKTFHLQIVY